MKFRSTAILLFVFVVVATVVLAQSSSNSLEVASHELWGAHLVNADGLSLYLYTLDADADGSACVDACANNWPPLLIDGEAVSGEGVDAALVGSIERADGSVQLTYGGWPLYRSRRDVQPDHVRGQGLGSQFYLVSPSGVAVTEQVDQVVVEVPQEVFDALYAEGQVQFMRNCMACHGAEGQGGAGPSLAGMQALSDSSFVISTIIVGRLHHGMPAFGALLDDNQIASIATYVRNSWGNDFGAALPEEVPALR